MKLNKAFRYAVRILYQKLFAVITALTIFTLLFLYLLITPSVLTKWQNDLQMVWNATFPLILFMYGILIAVTLPPIISAWVNIGLMSNVLHDKKNTSLPFTQDQLRSSYYSRMPLSDREWFFCISHSYIHIYHRKYIRKIEYIHTKRAGRGYLYGAEIRTCKGSCFCVWFGSRQERELFINWVKRYR